MTDTRDITWILEHRNSLGQWSIVAFNDSEWALGAILTGRDGIPDNMGNDARDILTHKAYTNAVWMDVAHCKRSAKSCEHSASVLDWMRYHIGNSGYQSGEKHFRMIVGYDE